MVQDLLHLPLVSLQVEGCKPGDEVADVQFAEEMEAGHEEIHHVVVVGLTSCLRAEVFLPHAVTPASGTRWGHTSS